MRLVLLPCQDFSSTIAHVRRSPLGCAGLDDVAKHKKLRKMLWCVAEGHRALKRALWQSSASTTSTTIFQDARQAKLSIRFNMASSDLDRRAGHLGTIDLAKEHNLDSTGIQEGTMAVISRFCTPVWSPPYVAPHRLVAKTLDYDLYQKLTTSIETFVSDAAADEIRAGHMLAGQCQSVNLTAKPDLPNLRLAVRDKPHSMRRLTQRCWKM